MPWTLMEAAWWVGRKHDRTNYLNLYLPPDQCTIPLDRGGYCGPVFVLRPFHRTFYATLEYNTRATPLAGPTGRPWLYPSSGESSRNAQGDHVACIFGTGSPTYVIHLHS